MPVNTRTVIALANKVLDRAGDLKLTGEEECKIAKAIEGVLQQLEARAPMDARMRELASRVRSALALPTR